MINSNIFVFDIETIPDIESAKSLLNLPKKTIDKKVHQEIAKYHNPDKPADEVFLKVAFHKIVAISYAEIAIEHSFEEEKLTLKTLRSGGTIESSEKELVESFFKYMENKKPRLVSFNGRAFDIPVLKYRAMKYNIKTNIYKLGDKWNGYGCRYSKDWHTDLHETLTDFYASGRLKLNEACAVFNYPGKLDIDGSTVYDLYKKKKLNEIRDYCETDVLNTYLVYLSYALHNSIISNDSYDSAIKQIKDFLEENKDKIHFKAFLNKWQELEGEKEEEEKKED